MASTIKIKRSGDVGSPSSLAAGELAYSWSSNKLYVGTGTETNGAAANIDIIGGKLFTDMLDHTAGTVTANSALIVDANSKLDILNVDNLTLNGNTLSSTNIDGDINLTPNGTGKTVITNPYIGVDSLQEYIYDTVGGAVTAGTGITITNSDVGNTSVVSITNTITAGSIGSATLIPVITYNAQGQITATTTAAIATNLAIAGDTGTDTVSLLTDVLSVVGGEGIDVVVTNNTVTVSGELATTSNIGVASFNSSDFSVSSGAVSISNVNLGTQTTGNYVATIAGTTNQVNVSGSGSETAAVTLSLPQNIHSGATPSFAGMSLSANLAMGSNRITGLADPVGDQDAATKYYVDAARSGLDVKQSVRATTTANITLSGTQVVDGVSLTVGDRVLVKDQTNAINNGIYVVASGAWTRAADADEPAEVSPGLFLFVEEGATNGDNGYVITSDAPLAVGTDALTFTQFSGTGMIVAGDGLSKTGNTLNVNVANGIEITSDNVQLASTVAGNGLTYSSGVLAVGGTADRITVSADAIDIASTYVGQSSITTLGTIATGTWSATTIATTRGGTGLTTYSTGDLLYASAANTLAKLSIGAEGKTLQVNGAGVPVWADIDGGTY